MLTIDSKYIIDEQDKLNIEQTFMCQRHWKDEKNEIVTCG